MKRIRLPLHPSSDLDSNFQSPTDPSQWKLASVKCVLDRFYYISSRDWEEQTAVCVYNTQQPLLNDEQHRI